MNKINNVSKINAQNLLKKQLLNKNYYRSVLFFFNKPMRL